MLNTQRLVGSLRALLILAFGALLFAQLRVLPAMYDDWVRSPAQSPPIGWLLPVAVLELLCIQIVIVCTWRLLAMVAADRIFSDASLVWVNTILAAMTAGLLLMAGALVGLVAQGGHSEVAGALLLMLVTGSVLGLLMVVMRALLRQATMLRDEMASVI